MMSDYQQDVIDTLRNVVEAQKIGTLEDWHKIESLNKQLGKAIGVLRGLLWCDVSEYAKEVINRSLAELEKGE